MIIHGDCFEEMRKIPSGSVHSIVTDPPYGLEFLNLEWDSFIRQADRALSRMKSGRRPKPAKMAQEWNRAWAVEALRVLKPGGHMIAFSGSRTYHTLAMGVELAGFEIRDQLQWIYSEGFPKSTDIAKQIDKQSGVWRGRSGIAKKQNQSMDNPNYRRTEKGSAKTELAKKWEGWGTALKPAHEPMVLARKAPEGPVTRSLQRHGVGGLNIDGCRVEINNDYATGTKNTFDVWNKGGVGLARDKKPHPLGRFPANVMHDGSEEVFQHLGSSARCFYYPKARGENKNRGLSGKNTHPTAKPLNLMRYLVRMVTPPGGVVLDPFMGSGTTGLAAIEEGFGFIGIERDEKFFELCRERLEKP